jgi:Flp pilus assembly pilin Flp
MSTLKGQSAIAQLRRTLSRFGAQDGGATAVEYALIAIVIGVPILASTTGIRDALVGLLSAVVDGLVTANSGA